MVSLLLILTGCTPTIAVPTTQTTEAEEELATRYFSVTKVPKVDNLQTVGSDGVYPPDINPIKVSYGDELSTWTVTEPLLGIEKGDPLSLYIFNRTGEVVTYNVSIVTNKEYDKNGNEIKYRDNSKNEYEMLSDAVFWTKLSDRVIVVQPEMVGAVAVRIDVPKKTKDFSLPDYWGFRVLVYPEQGGNIQRAYSQLWLISMR